MNKRQRELLDSAAKHDRRGEEYQQAAARATGYTQARLIGAYKDEEAMAANDRARAANRTPTERVDHEERAGREYYQHHQE